MSSNFFSSSMNKLTTNVPDYNLLNQMRFRPWTSKINNYKQPNMLPTRQNYVDSGGAS